jgi:hypothetical protein
MTDWDRARLLVAAETEADAPAVRYTLGYSVVDGWCVSADADDARSTRPAPTSAPPTSTPRRLGPPR